VTSKKESKSTHKSLQNGFSRSPELIGLSLCLIVKNEEQHLAQCLNSVKSIADEIILVDTGSSDRTVNLAKNLAKGIAKGISKNTAKKHQTKIFHFQWCDDFSKARNFAISKAKGQWILMIDADEVLEQGAIAALQTVMAQDDCLAANILRTESGINQAPYSYVMRLFRNHPEVRFWGYYHESIDQSITKLQAREPHWRLLDIDVPVLHHCGYTAQEIDRKQKYEFAKRLMTKHLDAFPDDIYMHSKLGALYINAATVHNGAEDADHLSLGLQLLQRGLSLTENREDHVLTRFELLFHLGLAYEHGGDSLLAQDAYLQAIALNISDLVKLPAYMNLGGIYQEKQQPEAIAYFAKVIEIAPDYAQGHFNYGAALKTAGRFTDAIASYERAIALQPQYAQAYQSLGVALIKIGYFQKAMAAFTNALQLYEQQGNYSASELLREGLREL
jgi:glycosyltransferase involved in cell wall biosynthesis